ncbi:MAG TPA: molecular chaperone DnaK, partial [Pseudohaliea sp.]|nr:molecular chaperone DnaK [Pseudohaliea sp.]
DEKAAIEAAITEAEEAVKGDDKDAIDAAANKLTEATGPVAQKMYAAQAESAGAEGAGPQADAGDAAGGGDDAVDAEFEEVDDDKK